MATIHDVAKKASVSVATVSRFLNESGYVGKKSREAIEKAIQELNFIPNNVARTLSTRQSNLIGLIIPDIKNPFFPELARAVEDTAYKNGYTVVLCNSDENSNKEKQYLQTLNQKYVAGVILTSTREGYNQKIKVPVVALDRQVSEDIPSVMTNNVLGMQLATNHILECGATELLFLKGPKQLISSNERLKGFLNVVEGKNMITHILECPYEFDVSEKNVFDYLQKNPSINGIIASSDVSAIGAMRACYKLNKKVPEDIQIIGFDGIQIGAFLTPSLTTIAQNIYKLGEAATQMLITQIEGKGLDNPKVCINPELIVRATTRKEFSS